VANYFYRALRGRHRHASEDSNFSWTLVVGCLGADVRDLELDRDTGQLYAATFGRGAFRAQLETILPVRIDVKPDTTENMINMKSQGNIPVAILSSPAFDAPAEVDTTSLMFGRTGNETSLAMCNKDAQDVNGDGLRDQICHFTTAVTEFQAGDTRGILKGKTREGVPIEGSDAVTIKQ
jgi:hypothetical protein